MTELEAGPERWQDIPTFAALLPAFLEDLRRTLRADLVGVYLYGSAVAGGFDTAHSDLDLVVVTARSIDDLDFGVLAGLVDRLAAREPGWAERLDIVFVGRPTLATFRDGGPLASISHDEPLQRTADADTWLQTWYLARMAATPLIGPPIEEIIPPIPLGEFVEAVTRDAGRIIRLAQDPDTGDGLLAYTLLTLARVRRVRETGEIVPKDEAGSWLADRLPAWRDVIATAVAVRRGGTADEGWRERARELAARVLAPSLVRTPR